MPKFKNIRIKKPGGGTRLQRVQVLASGKYKFVKNKTTPRRAGTARKAPVRRRRARTTTVRRRRATNMARRGRKKGSRRKQKIPILATAGMIVGLKNLYDGYKEGGTHRVMVSLTGYDPNYGFNWKWATATIPMVLGAGGSMLAAKTGINRYVKVPYFKL